MRVLSWLLLATATAHGGGADSVHPGFAPVQPDEFAVAGSLSNAWADFDGDGDLDFAVSLKTGEIRLYRNDNGQFVNIGPSLGFPHSGNEMRGLAWGDLDGDGWPDLYAGATSVDAANLLLRNQRGRMFTNVGTGSPITAAGRSARQSSFVDFDNDGIVDFYATNRSGPNALYRATGSGFQRVASEIAGDDPRATVGACWLDFDSDGDLDLFLANQAGGSDAFWRNDGVQFVDIAETLGISRPGRPREEGSVGCAVGDYDNDGLLDLFVAAYGVNALYRNTGQGGFEDVTGRMGFDQPNRAVGAAWADFDNDGFLDLFVTAYAGPSGQQVPANRLYRNLGGKGFVDQIDVFPHLNVADHGVQWVDYDRDGAIDLSLTRGYTSQGGHFVFRNLLAPDDAARSLAVKVLGTKRGATMTGAEVRIFDARGMVLGTRQVSSGEGYNAQSLQPLHFGLPSVEPVAVELTVMSKKGRLTRRYDHVDPTRYRRKAFVVEPR
jgi:hypothetical protein